MSLSKRAPLRKERVIEAITALIATSNRSHRDLNLDPSEQMYAVVGFADEVIRQMVEVTGGDAPAEVLKFLQAAHTLRSLTAAVGRLNSEDGTVQ